VNTKVDAALWLWRMHNVVNERLGKDQATPGKAVAVATAAAAAATLPLPLSAAAESGSLGQPDHVPRSVYPTFIDCPECYKRTWVAQEEVHLTMPPPAAHGTAHGTASASASASVASGSNSATAVAAAAAAAAGGVVIAAAASVDANAAVDTAAAADAGDDEELNGVGGGGGRKPSKRCTLSHTTRTYPLGRRCPFGTSAPLSGSFWTATVKTAICWLAAARPGLLLVCSLQGMKWTLHR
jgi:hypothetical protein